MHFLNFLTCNNISTLFIFQSHYKNKAFRCIFSPRRCNHLSLTCELISVYKFFIIYLVKKTRVATKNSLVFFAGNKIEGTPILKLAMINSSSKILSKISSKKFVYGRLENLCKKILKKLKWRKKIGKNDTNLCS